MFYHGDSLVRCTISTRDPGEPHANVKTDHEKKRSTSGSPARAELGSRRSACSGARLPGLGFLRDLCHLDAVRRGSSARHQGCEVRGEEEEHAGHRGTSGGVVALMPRWQCCQGASAKKPKQRSMTGPRSKRISLRTSGIWVLRRDGAPNVVRRHQNWTTPGRSQYLPERSAQVVWPTRAPSDKKTLYMYVKTHEHY